MAIKSSHSMVKLNLAPLIKTYVSTRYGRQSTEGYAQGSRLSADRCASYELDGDERHTQGFYPGSAAVRA
jgi:hypothetical protein